MKYNTLSINPTAYRKSMATKRQIQWQRIMERVPGTSEREKWRYLCSTFTYREIAKILSADRKIKIMHTTVRKRALQFGIKTNNPNHARLGSTYTKRIVTPKFDYLQYMVNVDFICRRDYRVTASMMAQMLVDEWLRVVGKCPSKVDVPWPIHLEALAMMEE